MGRNLLKVLFSVSLSAFLAISGPVFAQDLTLQDLGIEQPGILPSNPFYFFKSWGRTIRQTLTFSDISRVELQLEILNEQAAEVRKLAEINPDKLEGFERAVKNYIDSAVALKTRVQALKPNQVGNSKFLDLFLDRALKHKEILDELMGRFKKNESYEEFYNLIIEAEERLTDAVAVIPGNIEDAKKFRDRFQSVIVKQKGELREFIASEFIDQLEPKIRRDARDELLKLKDSLLLRWAGRLRGLRAAIDNNSVGASFSASGTENQTFNALSNFPGDAKRRLKVLDEAREKIADISVKNNINIIRQQILDTVREEGGASKANAESAIADAGNIITEVRARLAEAENRAGISGILDRAIFNLAAAKNFFEDGSYGSAYSSALAASAAAKNALSSLIVKATDYGDELQSIKQYYDALSAKTKDNGLIADQNPKIFALMKNAESQIVKTADLINSGSDSPKIASAIRELKAILSSIEQLIEEALKFNASVPTP